jgi:hypothetical protein
MKRERNIDHGGTPILMMVILALGGFIHLHFEY